MKEKHYRDVYISLLTEASSLKRLGYIECDLKTDPIRHRSATELSNAGYVEGMTVCSPASISISQITVQGRRFLDELKKEAREASWVNWIWSKGSVVFGFILGASADLFKDIWVYFANHYFPGIVPLK